MGRGGKIIIKMKGQKLEGCCERLKKQRMDPPLERSWFGISVEMLKWIVLLGKEFIKRVINTMGRQLYCGDSEERSCPLGKVGGGGSLLKGFREMVRFYSMSLQPGCP